MAASNSIDLLVPSLVSVYSEAKANYKHDHPGGLSPRLGETYRPNNVQAAYYAQGRKPLSEVNALRKVAELAPIGAAENKKIITYKLPGTGKHNKNPSEAFDVQMVKPNGEIDWSDAPYIKFAEYVQRAAAKLKVKVVSGAYWKMSDFPHHETA